MCYNGSVVISNKEKNMTRSDKVIGYLTLWVARVALAVLAFAGSVHLLAGIDEMIAYPISILLVALLVKETL